MTFLASLAAWFLGTRVGRWCAIAAGVLAALLTFGMWNRAKGRQDEHERQVEADHAAVQRADRAAVDYRRGGDAGDKLRSGDF